MYDDSDIDGDLLARPQPRYNMRREPDDELANSPVHIALVSWLVSTGLPDWPRQLNWVVVAADRASRGGRPTVHSYRLEPTDGIGWSRLVASVRTRIEQGSGPAWVAVPTRQVLTAHVFHEAGLPVTLGLAGNRAADRAVEMMQSSCQRLGVRRLPGHSSGPVQAAPREHRCEWLLALEQFGSQATDELCVLSDSVDAVEVAAALAVHRAPVEGYRGISDAALDRFDDARSGVRCPVRFRHVKAHNGHPLNEAADELARLGRVAARYERCTVEGELNQRADALAAAVALLGDDDHLLTSAYRHSLPQEPLSWSLADAFGDRG